MPRCINGTLISTATNNLGKVSAETLKTAHSQQESGRAIGKNAHDDFHQAGIANGGVMQPRDADVWDLYQVSEDFKYDGGGNGKGGVAKLSVNGKQVAEGRIEQTQAMMFSADETADVGLDNQTPVALGIWTSLWAVLETAFSTRSGEFRSRRLRPKTFSRA